MIHVEHLRCIEWPQKYAFSLRMHQISDIFVFNSFRIVGSLYMCFSNIQLIDSPTNTLMPWYV